MITTMTDSTIQISRTAITTSTTTGMKGDVIVTNDVSFFLNLSRAKRAVDPVLQHGQMNAL